MLAGVGKLMGETGNGSKREEWMLSGVNRAGEGGCGWIRS